MKCSKCKKINRFREYNASSYRLKCGKCGHLLAEVTMEDAEAVIVSCGTSRKGLDLEDCDSDITMHYWVYEYEYCVPGTNEIRKHRDKIKFTASAFGRWFEKYHENFKFPVRYDKAQPHRHIRLDNFEIENRREIPNKSELLNKYVKVEKENHKVQIFIPKIEYDDMHTPIYHWIAVWNFPGGASESEIQDTTHRIFENRMYFRFCIECGDYQPNGLLYKGICQRCAKQKS